MTAIKAYLLRLILCGFFVTLSGALLRGRRSGRVLALCGGCLMILTAVRPLLQVDLSELPDLFTGMTSLQRTEAAREKNDAILKQLVEEQTEAWLADQAAALGPALRFTVTARAAGESTFVPDSVAVKGPWTEAQRRELSAILEAELEIPPSRQTWSSG